MSSLAVKYRPNDWSDVTSQIGTIKVLQRQVELGEYRNAYLFTGPSGTGKTTLARILANKINKGMGEPIEIDAASNNGVEAVRSMTEQASQRALDAEYKIYIVDEAHQITQAGWAAFLKTIEQPPKYTIFMFCTTEFQKVPETIQNRCQQYKLTRIPNHDILKRLVYISNKEHFDYTKEALEQITKLALGSMRQAISYLEKCKDFGDITLENVLQVLGSFSYDTYFSLVNAIIDKNESTIITLIDGLYNEGSDLKLFVEMFLDFLLDLTKYVIFRSFAIIKIPESYKEKLEYTINVENAGKYFNHLIDKVLELKTLVKGDPNIKTTVEIYLLTRV